MTPVFPSRPGVAPSAILWMHQGRTRSLTITTCEEPLARRHSLRRVALAATAPLCDAHFSEVPSVGWCRLQDSNPPPHDYKSSALPDELSRPLKTQNYTLFDPREPCSSALARRIGLRVFIGRLV